MELKARSDKAGLRTRALLNGGVVEVAGSNYTSPSLTVGHRCLRYIQQHVFDHSSVQEGLAVD